MTGTHRAKTCALQQQSQALPPVSELAPPHDWVFIIIILFYLFIYSTDIEWEAFDLGGALSNLQHEVHPAAGFRRASFRREITRMCPQYPPIS